MSLFLCLSSCYSLQKGQTMFILSSASLLLLYLCLRTPELFYLYLGLLLHLTFLCFNTFLSLALVWPAVLFGHLGARCCFSWCKYKALLLCLGFCSETLEAENSSESQYQGLGSWQGPQGQYLCLTPCSSAQLWNSLMFVSTGNKVWYRICWALLCTDRCWGSLEREELSRRLARIDKVLNQ